MPFMRPTITEILENGPNYVSFKLLEMDRHATELAMQGIPEEERTEEVIKQHAKTKESFILLSKSKYAGRCTVQDGACHVAFNFGGKDQNDIFLQITERALGVKDDIEAVLRLAHSTFSPRV